jgi:Ca-activated chloride channel family protein
MTAPAPGGSLPVFDGPRSAPCAGLAGVLCLLIVGSAVPAGEQRAVVPRFRSGVDLVKVTATVRDGQGRLVGDLTRDDFEILEDGRPQRIDQFEQGRVPVSLGVVLDVSQSMLGQRMDDARAALRRFLVDLLEPGDEVFLMVFNHDPRLEAPWTRGPSRLRGRLDGVRPYGATAIYDALVMALPMFTSRAHDRAAVVLISDGSDTASDVTREDVRWQIRLSDAFVYAVGIDAPERRPINDRVNARLLREITAESGGYTEVVTDSPELAPATERIAEELNHQYTLAYAPARPPDGRYRRIRVQVRDGDYHVRARRGYVALSRP